MNGIRWRGAAAAVLVLVACDDPTSGTPDEAVATIEVGPSGRTLEVGDTLRLTATARNARGAVVAGARLTWSSEDTTVAWVTAEGSSALVRARAPGAAGVRASAGGRSGRAALSVATPKVEAATLAVAGLENPGEDPTGFMDVGHERVLSAEARSATGDLMPGLSVEWTSDAPDVASVVPATNGSPTALVRAHREGRALLTIRAGGRSLRATVVVARPAPAASAISLELDTLLMELGKHPELRAWVWAANGSWVDDPTVTWWSHDTTVVRVLGNDVGARGTLTGLKEGSARVSVYSGSRLASAIVRVKAPGPVGAVILVPNLQGAWTGDAMRLRAQVVTATGGPLADQPVTWSSSAPDVIDVDAVGRAWALRRGTARIMGESGGRVGYVDIRVYDRPLGPAPHALLPNEGPLGHPRPSVVLGTVTRLDSKGAARQAELWLTSGTFVLDGGAARYEQTLRVEAVAVVDGVLTVLDREERVDAGAVLFHVPGALVFRSSSTPGKEFTGAYVQGGLLGVTQALGDAPELQYLYRLKE